MKLEVDMSILLRIQRLQCQFLDAGGSRIHSHGLSLVELGVENELAEGIFHSSLQQALQGTGAELYVVALGTQPGACGIGELHVVAHFADALLQRSHLDIHDLMEALFRQLVKEDDVIQAIQELRRELLLQRLADDAASVLVLEVMIITVLRKSTVVPLPSVRRPSSMT